MKFTDTAIRALQPKPDRYEVAEANGKGFRIRIYPSGKKAFLARYRFGARSRVLVYGTWPGKSLAKARAEHGEALLLLSKGVDPATSRDRSGTVEKLAAEYIEYHAKPKKKTWRDDERMLDKDVLPRWRGRQACEITTRDVVEVLDKVGRRGGPIRERVRSVVSGMFRLGMRRGLVQSNPASGLESSASKPRERVLGDSEIRRIWRGVEGIPIGRPAQIAVQLLLLTGQRRGEMSLAQWSHLDLDAGIWFIPAENTKNKHAHRLPLSADAVALFRQLRKATSDSCPWVFAHRHAGRWRRYNPTTWSNLPPTYNYFGCEPWTLHDLRRTASTRIREAGTPAHIAEKILNHVPPVLVRTYDRADYTEPMRDALEAWAGYVRKVLEAEE